MDNEPLTDPSKVLVNLVLLLLITFKLLFTTTISSNFIGLATACIYFIICISVKASADPGVLFYQLSEHMCSSQILPLNVLVNL
jgi:hypothetical protein